jgi:hypothetical protein
MTRRMSPDALVDQGAMDFDEKEVDCCEKLTCCTSVAMRCIP